MFILFWLPRISPRTSLPDPGLCVVDTSLSATRVRCCTREISGPWNTSNEIFIIYFRTQRNVFHSLVPPVSVSLRLLGNPSISGPYLFLGFSNNNHYPLSMDFLWKLQKCCLSPTLVTWVVKGQVIICGSKPCGIKTWFCWFFATIWNLWIPSQVKFGI